MKTRAAVAYEKGKPLVVETVDLEGPKAGEVLVELKATGVCHTDEFTRSGADPEGLFPVIFGHEGRRRRARSGTGVTSVAPGDHVILLYTPPECRACNRACRARPICAPPSAHSGQVCARRHQPLFDRWQEDPHYMGCSTFGEPHVCPIRWPELEQHAPYARSSSAAGVTKPVGARVVHGQSSAAKTVWFRERRAAHVVVDFLPPIEKSRLCRRASDPEP